MDLVEENIDMSHKLINQVRQLSLSSIELTKNNNKPIPPALDKKLREDIKKLKQSIDLLLNHPKTMIHNLSGVLVSLEEIKSQLSLLTTKKNQEHIKEIYLKVEEISRFFKMNKLITKS